MPQYEDKPRHLPNKKKKKTTIWKSSHQKLSFLTWTEFSPGSHISLDLWECIICSDQKCNSSIYLWAGGKILGKGHHPLQLVGITKINSSWTNTSNLQNQHEFKVTSDTGVIMDYILSQPSSTGLKQRLFEAVWMAVTMQESYPQPRSCYLRNTFRVSAWVSVKFNTNLNTDVGVMTGTKRSILLKRKMLIDWAKSTWILQRSQDLGWRRLLIRPASPLPLPYSGQWETWSPVLPSAPQGNQTRSQRVRFLPPPSGHYALTYLRGLTFNPCVQIPSLVIA